MKVKCFEKFSLSREEELEEMFADISDDFSLNKGDRIRGDFLIYTPNSYSIEYGNYSLGNYDLSTVPEMNFLIPTFRNVYVMQTCVLKEKVENNFQKRLEEFQKRITYFGFRCEKMEINTRSQNNGNLLSNIIIYTLIIKDMNEN